MKFQIKNRWTGNVQFECELDAAFESSPPSIQLGAAVKVAITTGANLYGADLYGANLYGAYLYGANLTSANLYGADLTSANLTGANLYGANLTSANLTGADLTSANLTGANLYGAYLYGANLYGAYLSGANLTSANLTPIRDDIWAILSSAPAEVPALLDAIKAGKIDGSTYSGYCACLVGTLAQARGCDEFKISGLRPDPSRPAEMFFATIQPGHTPENHQPSRIAYDWVGEWLANMRAAFAVPR